MRWSLLSVIATFARLQLRAALVFASCRTPSARPQSGEHTNTTCSSAIRFDRRGVDAIWDGVQPVLLHLRRMALKQRRTEEKLLPPELCLRDRSLPRALTTSCLQFLAVTDFPSLIGAGRRGRDLFVSAMKELRRAVLILKDDNVSGLRWAIGMLRGHCRHLISIDLGPHQVLPADVKEALAAVIASNTSSLTCINPPAMASAPATASALAHCPRLTSFSIDLGNGMRWWDGDSNEMKLACRTVDLALAECPLVTIFQFNGWRRRQLTDCPLHIDIFRSRNSFLAR